MEGKRLVKRLLVRLVELISSLFNGLGLVAINREYFFFASRWSLTFN